MITTISSVGQTAQEDLKPRIIPPNPDAASLGKFADFQNKNYTGTPDISIGLYDIVENDIKHPLTLTYDASGVKVQTQSTWVGLGWVLNAGGVITRSVRGVADGKATTNYASVSQSIIQGAITGNMGMLTGTNLYNAKAIVSGDFDADPDIYYLSAAGMSCKFIETQEGIITLDRSELRIVKLSTGWKVYDQSGFIYTFDQTEETLPNNYKETRDFVSAWFLSSIRSPNGSVVNFIYKLGGKEKTAVSKSYSYDVTYNPTTGYPNAFTSTRTSSSYSYSKKRILLDRITYSTGQIVFSSTEGRSDFAASDSNNPVLSSGYKLNGITILTLEGDTVKHFALLNSYFHNGSSGYANYRLRLDGVTEAPSAWHVAANKLTKKYAFEYFNPTHLPSVESEDIDHWGYYKLGATLLPTYDLSQFRVISSSRDAGNAAVTAGTMKRIYYPTAGYTEFEYEPHDYSKAGTTPVNEDVVIQYDRNARAKKPEDPPMGWNAQGYSEIFTVDANTLSMKINIAFAFSSLMNYSQLKIEIVRPTFALNAEPIPANIISEQVIQFFWAQNTPVSEDVVLAPGAYFLKATTTANNASVTGTLTIKQKTGTLTSKYAGGLRLSRMISYDPSTQKSLIKKFTYKDPANPNLSSGVLVTPVKYDFSRKTVQAKSCGQVNGTPVWCPDMLSECDGTITNRLEIRSSTSYPLGQTQGGFIGYKCVQIEELDELSQPLGKTVETYTSPDGFVDHPRTFPSVTGTSFDLFRGQLLTQTVYDQSDRPLYEKQNQYDFFNYKNYIGAAMVDAYSHTGSATSLSVCAFEISFYDNVAGKSILKRTVEKTYSYAASAQQVKTSKTSYYAANKSATPSGRAHTFPTKTVKWISDADSITTDITYAVDLSGTAVIDTMFNRHIVSPQIETVQVLSLGSKTIYKRKNEYAFFGGKPLPSIIQESNDGITYVESIRFDAYDSLGRVVQWKDRGNVAEYYTWNKKRNLPSLKITGSTTALVHSNDFENSHGNSTDAHSGLKSRTGSYTFSMAGLVNGTYNLTYWQKQSSAWVFKNSLVTVSGGSYSTTITGQIDDLRFYPITAQLTNYIYDNAGRVTCILDVNSIPKYFEYDKSGRLELVRDDNKNILKTYQYKYQIR